MSKPVNDETSMEEPPPYSEVAENGAVSVDQGFGVTAASRLNVQKNHPSQSNTSQSSLHWAQSSHPESTHSSASFARPPAGPPPKRHPLLGETFPADKKPSPGPPPGRPSGQPSDSPFHHPPPPGPSLGGYYSALPLPERPQLRYPKGYYCPKCRNTGVKVHKGTSCKDCFERFGVRSQAQYLPPGIKPVFNAPPRVVPPGDPSIGGWLCGRCRGAGFITDFLIFDSTCPVCHGVGRVF